MHSEAPINAEIPPSIPKPPVHAKPLTPFGISKKFQERNELSIAKCMTLLLGIHLDSSFAAHMFENGILLGMQSIIYLKRKSN